MNKSPLSALDGGERDIKTIFVSLQKQYFIYSYMYFIFIYYDLYIYVIYFTFKDRSNHENMPILF